MYSTNNRPLNNIFKYKQTNVLLRKTTRTRTTSRINFQVFLGHVFQNRDWTFCLKRWSEDTTLIVTEKPFPTPSRYWILSFSCKLRIGHQYRSRVNRSETYTDSKQIVSGLRNISCDLFWFFTYYLTSWETICWYCKNGYNFILCPWL